MGRSCLRTCFCYSLTQKHCFADQTFANHLQFLHVFFENRRVFHNIHNVFHNSMFFIFAGKIFANKIVNHKYFIRKCFFPCINTLQINQIRQQWGVNQFILTLQLLLLMSPYPVEGNVRDGGFFDNLTSGISAFLIIFFMISL